MREKTAVINLREVKEIFDRARIRYWLDWGTLLGAVRDEKMIEWNHDIDLGTTDDNLAKIIAAIPRLEEKGFRISISYLRIHEDIFRKKIRFDRADCPLDIWVYDMRDRYAWNALLYFPQSRNFILEFFLMKFMRLLYYSLSHTRSPDPPSAKVIPWLHLLIPSKAKKIFINMIRALLRHGCGFYAIIIPKKYFEKLDTIRFCEMTFNIPCKVKDYLEYHYGEGMRTPKKQWDTLRDDGAVHIISAPLSSGKISSRER